MQAFVNSVMYSKFLSVCRGIGYTKIAVPKADAQGATTDSEPRACRFAKGAPVSTRDPLNMSAPTKLPRTEICIVKRACEISDAPHLPPFAKLPEKLCRKPYFHIYHIIPHIKKIVKALVHKNLDYLYDYFGKRIVKSYKRGESRENAGNLKKFILIGRKTNIPSGRVRRLSTHHPAFTTSRRVRHPRRSVIIAAYPNARLIDNPPIVPPPRCIRVPPRNRRRSCRPRLQRMHLHRAQAAL